MLKKLCALRPFVLLQKRHSAEGQHAMRLMLALVVLVGSSGAAVALNKAEPTRAVQSLDGGDWRLGSFAMQAGLAAGAEKESFNDQAFRRVQVPGEVQIQTGFKGQELFTQSKQLTEINNQEWWYRKQFRAAPAANGKHVFLRFEAVDYFASVWLNGKLLGTHEGTFVPFSFDVTALLRTDRENLLAVRVTHPAIPKDRGLNEYINGNFTETTYSDTIAVSHPPYTVSTGWDGLSAHGNTTFPMGIWRSVSLETVDNVIVTDLVARTLSIEPDGTARLLLAGTVENLGTAPVDGRVRLNVDPEDFNGRGVTAVTVPVHAVEGRTAFEAEVQVPKARLWWTWDSGAQALYRFTAHWQMGEEENIGDVQSVRFGIRTITRDPDMTYRLNGKRMFIKEAWFPMEDYYGSRSTHQGYERDLRLLRDDNLNTLVNFTVVEKPDFYDLCDELGIMMVVEMPFPQFGPGQVLNADSPRREPFLREAKLEMEQIVTMLRTHPSIIEWAPLAESHNSQGGWGFGGLVFDQGGYQAFEDEMRELVIRLQPDAIFHPSLCDLGEKHFWMASAGYRYETTDYQTLYDAAVNFVSEYGGISMSASENLDDYLTPKQQWDAANKRTSDWFGLPIDISAYAYLTSSEYDSLYSMLYRTEHYIDRDIRSVRELVDATQEYQAFTLKYATEAFRRKNTSPSWARASGIFWRSVQDFATGFSIWIEFRRWPTGG